MINGKKPNPALLLAFTSCLLLSVVAGAAGAASERWKAVSGKEGTDRILYDRDSVVPSGANRFRVWIAGFDKDGFPRKSLEEIDCPNRIVRDVEVVIERPNKPVSHTFTPSDWRDVPRESPRGELLKVLCR